VVGIQPQQARRQPASLDGVLDQVADRCWLRKPWRAGRRYDVGRERHRAQDHEREAEAVEGVAIFGPQPSADRDGQQEMSAVDEAARVLEEVPVGELRGCGLQDQRGFITVKQVPIERR
jgi:hypothetical protein